MKETYVSLNTAKLAKEISLEESISWISNFKNSEEFEACVVNPDGTKNKELTEKLIRLGEINAERELLIESLKAK